MQAHVVALFPGSDDPDRIRTKTGSNPDLWFCGCTLGHARDLLSFETTDECNFGRMTVKKFILGS